MNSSCPIGAFGYGPNHVPWTISKSNLSVQTTVPESLGTKDLSFLSKSYNDEICETALTNINDLNVK